MKPLFAVMQYQQWLIKAGKLYGSTLKAYSAKLTQGPLLSVLSCISVH
jgi:hypothetical protein